MTTSKDLIFIDSKNRTVTSTSSSDFSITLTENVGGLYQLVHLSLLNSLYNVVAGENDKLYVEHSVDGAQTLTLSPGNYTTATLATEVKTQLDTISAVVYTVTYSSTTGKYTVSPDSGTFAYRFATNTTASSRFLLGKDAVDDGLAASQVSDNMANISLHDSVAVKISQDSNAHVTLPNGTEASFLIPVDVSFGSVLHYKNNQVFQQYVRFGSNTSSLTIQLYANDGDLLDINGVDWSMSLKYVAA